MKSRVYGAGSIYRRAGRGGWTAQWYEASGRQRQRKVATIAAAEAVLDQVTARRAAANGLAGVDVSLRDYAKTWLLRLQPHVRHGTIRVYVTVLELHWLPEIGDLRLSEISTHLVRNVLAAKLTAGVSKKYASNMRQVLHALFEDAVADEIVSANPVRFHGKDRMKLSTTKAERQSKVKAFDGEQLRALFEACARHRPQRLALFRLLAMTGLRIGEALGLRWDDIDWRKREARIARSYTSSRLELPKSGLVAAVDLSQGLVDELREWQRAAKAKALEHGYKLAPWVFPALRHPKLMTDANDVAEDFKRVLAAAGLPGHLTPHCLRHTFATQHLLHGTSVYYVQRQLRHSSIQITVDTYGSWLPAGNVEHADALERRLLGEVPVSGLSAIEPSGGHSGVRRQAVKR